MLGRKEYIGDGVYAELQGLQVILTTAEPTGRIALSCAAVEALRRYVDRCTDARAFAALATVAERASAERASPALAPPDGSGTPAATDGTARGVES